MTRDKPAHADLPYRPCVGIMLLNEEARVFVGQRIDPEAGEAWQMPQGGIDSGEDLAQAARRELEEETGIAHVEILAEARDWLHYDLPAHLLGKALKGKYRGQTQKWFAMRFLGRDADIDLARHHDPEFATWRWAEPEELPRVIVDFKRGIYEAVLQEFAPVIADLRRRRA